MKNGYSWAVSWALLGVTGAALFSAAQTAYQPKFPGDPAHSDSEAISLGYMRTVLRAQRTYNQKNHKYADSLADLVHTGSFTRRMVNLDRGDYTVSFHPHKDGFDLLLTPKQEDADHRSFYAKEDGVIHGDAEKPATADSPPIK
ncbi:MAG: hypothetical protein ACLP6G_19245 [Terriglobales bacterium]